MVMPRKGTRRIVVEGRAYRWSVNLNDRSSEAPLICIEQEGGGQRLLAGFDATWMVASRVGGIPFPPAGVDLVKPAIIRRMILTALVDGWKPDQRGLPPLRLDHVAPSPEHQLVVDGHTYEWTAVASADGRGVTVWVSPEAAGGQRLESTFDCSSTGQRAAGAVARALVSATMVRRVVVAGLAAGWRPDRRELTPFRLESAKIAVGLP
jgi:hypothetical protein